MKKLVNIDDELLTQVKNWLRHHVSPSATFCRRLRALLHHPTQDAPKPPTPLVTFAGNGLNPGVDLDSNAALLEIMDGR